MRKRWLRAMERVDSFGDKIIVYCCEDYFDVNIEKCVSHCIPGEFRVKTLCSPLSTEFLATGGRNGNINLNKYMIFSSGNQTHNQPRLQSHFVPLPQLASWSAAHNLWYQNLYISSYVYIVIEYLKPIKLEWHSKFLQISKACS